ncbi:MAG: hypothetical protein IT181_16770, partial [Acidobacteria bacterium]|nr:hypothetical protein [Acidobacteriota bacterium]
MPNERHARVARPERFMAVVLALAAVVVASAVTGSSLAARRQTGTRQTVPPHLVLLSAGIEQEATIGSAARVFFRVTLAGRPPCGPGEASPLYTFLIDRDRSLTTGVVL